VKPIVVLTGLENGLFGVQRVYVILGGMRAYMASRDTYRGRVQVDTDNRLDGVLFEEGGNGGGELFLEKIGITL